MPLCSSLQVGLHAEDTTRSLQAVLIPETQYVLRPTLKTQLAGSQSMPLNAFRGNGQAEVPTGRVTQVTCTMAEACTVFLEVRGGNDGSLIGWGQSSKKRYHSKSDTGLET